MTALLRRPTARPATGRSVATSAVTVTTVGVLPVSQVGVLSVQVRADLWVGPGALGLRRSLLQHVRATSFLAGP